MPFGIFKFAVPPAVGQALVWDGRAFEPGTSAPAASGLSGLTLNRVPFGNSLGGLQDSANLTFDGTTLAVTGGMSSTGVSSFSGAANSNAAVSFGLTNPLTGATQFATVADFRGSSAATIARGAFFRSGTAAVAFTCAEVTAFNAAANVIGAGSTITRNVGGLFSVQAGGTNNYGIVHTAAISGAATGDWFLWDDSGYANSLSGAVTLTAASSGLTIAKTTGTTLTVASTTASTTTGTGCATFAGGIGVAGQVTFGGGLVAKVNNGATINLDLSDTAASRTTAVFRVNTSATAHTAAALFDCVSSASTSSDKMVRVRANSVDLWTVNADGSAVASGVWSMTNTTDSTSIASGGLVLSGGLGVAKRLTLDGATGKTLKYVNPTVNAAVATTMGAVGPTGSTAGNPLGWIRIDVAGTDRFIPYW